MIRVRIQQQRVNSRAASRDLIHRQKTGARAGLEVVRRSQGKRFHLGQGPRGPQRANKKATDIAKARGLFSTTPGVRTGELANWRNWRIIELPNALDLVPPKSRVLVAKYLAKLGFQFGMSAKERIAVRDSIHDSYRSFRLSKFTTLHTTGN